MALLCIMDACPLRILTSGQRIAVFVKQTGPLMLDKFCGDRTGQKVDRQNVRILA